MNHIIVVFIVLCAYVTFAQNLVLNPSFEQTKGVYTNFTHEEEVGKRFEDFVIGWHCPNNSSPDILMPDFAEELILSANPRIGENSVGLIFNRNLIVSSYKGIIVDSTYDYCYAEAVGSGLSKSLQPGRTYYCEFWIRKAETILSKFNHSQIMYDFGIQFSEEAIQVEEFNFLEGVPHIPADTSTAVTIDEWTKVSGYFTPEKAYNYLYITQFKKGENDPPYLGKYFLIDDVLVEEVTDFSTLDNSVRLPVGTKIPLRNVNFTSGTTEFSNEKSIEVIEKLTEYLNQNQAIRVRINGHTDAQGNAKTNLALSQRRAKTIASLLIEQGIDAGRIESSGYGEEKPIATNKTAEGRAQNRRVEFEVVE